MKKIHNTFKKSDITFKNEVFNLVGDEYELLEEYKNVHTPIKILHTRCKNIFKMSPSNFLHGQRCSFCNSNFNKININKARDAFMHKNLQLLSTTYKNSKEKLKYKCLICGDENFISYADLVYKNNGCPKCAKNKKLKFSDIKSKIECVDGYTLVSSSNDFKNVHSRLKILHNCGLIYENSYNNFRNGQRCPFCEKANSSKGLSKGVRSIIRYFIDNKIIFEREKRLLNLNGDKRPLRIDFYLPDYQLYLEYNGSQHYMSFSNSSIFNKERLKKIQESDMKKQKYMKEHNYNFEIISYHDNVLDQLKEILLKYKKI